MPTFELVPAGGNGGGSQEGGRQHSARCRRRSFQIPPERRERPSHSSLQHIGDARIEITDARIGSHADALATPRVSTTREWLGWISAFGLVTLAASGAIAWSLRPKPPAPEMRVEITTPQSADPVSLDSATKGYARGTEAKAARSSGPYRKRECHSSSVELK
jgi:hypothetical protein